MVVYVYVYALVRIQDAQWQSVVYCWDMVVTYEYVVLALAPSAADVLAVVSCQRMCLYY
jgi:hypothetical protein